MKVVFASDHAGFDLKNILLSYVRDELRYAAEDVGALIYDAEDDYTDFVAIAARMVAEDPENTKAIILGGSGQGEAMYANRFKGVRAGVYYGGNMQIIHLLCAHNNANILSLGARFIDEELAREAVKVWLSEEASKEEKYTRRIYAMDQ